MLLLFFEFNVFIQTAMTSEFPAVPSLRALAFNRLVERYRLFETKGREDQLVLLLSKLPVTLIPEFMRRKAAFEALDAADDIVEVVEYCSEAFGNRIITAEDTRQCHICDHEQEISIETSFEYPDSENEATVTEIKRVQSNKRQKLLTHHLDKPVCPYYGFVDDDERSS